MRILHINASDIKGGAAKVAYGLKQEQERQGHDVSMAVSLKYSKDPNVFQIKKPNAILKKIYQLTGLNIEQLLKRKTAFFLANDLTLFPSSRSILKSQAFLKADIVHVHNLHSYYFNLDILREMSLLKPIVWTFHDMWPITAHCAHAFDGVIKAGFFTCPSLDIYPPIAWHNEKYLTHKKQSIYESCKNLTIVSPSQWLKNKVSQSVLKSKSSELIYNGIDSTIFQPNDKTASRHELGLPANKKLVLFLAKGGKNNPWKGWHFFEDIVQHYSNNKEVVFLALGGNNEIRADNVINLPYISDEKTLAKYYSSADVLLYPSIADNCPLVVLEAQACGLPIVSFTTGGIPELIHHKKTGYLVESKQKQELISGLEYIFNLSDQDINAMRDEARSHILKNFTIEKMANRYLDLYKNLVKPK